MYFSAALELCYSDEVSLYSINDMKTTTSRTLREGLVNSHTDHPPPPANLHTHRHAIYMYSALKQTSVSIASLTLIALSVLIIWLGKDGGWGAAAQF